MSTAKLAGQVKKKICFVIGPIGSEGDDSRINADWLMQLILKPVLEDSEFNFEVVRADQIPDPGTIGKEIIRHCKSADLIIADLTDHNPNAFYELAIAHCYEVPVIPIIAIGQIIPFDNSGVRTIQYSLETVADVEVTKNELRRTLTTVCKPDYKVSNPITAALGEIKLAQTADPEKKILLNLKENMDFLTRKVAENQAEIDAIKNGQKRTTYFSALTGSTIEDAIKASQIPTVNTGLASKSYDPSLGQIFTTPFPKRSEK